MAEETEETCCTRGEWNDLEWVSECREFAIELDGNDGAVTITLTGDEWEFKDEFYGSIEEAKKYAYNLLFGVDDSIGIASTVAVCKKKNAESRDV